jgi:hypothetical protein
MLYGVMATFITLIGLAMVYFSFRVLATKSWFFGWLRGMWGLALVAIGITLGLSAFDLFSYKQIVSEQSVATISFEQLRPQRYTAIVVDSDGGESRYELAGDQWQMDARLIKWPNAVAALGIKPGYRLDRISGRYYSLEKERTAERTVYSLSASKLGFDLWEIFHGSDTKIIDAVYGTATFVPMSDGALYEVLLSNTGLLARPLNETARAAVERWE